MVLFRDCVLLNAVNDMASRLAVNMAVFTKHLSAFPAAHVANCCRCGFPFCKFIMCSFLENSMPKYNFLQILYSASGKRCKKPVM